MLDLSQLRSLGRRPVHYYETVDTTMRVAAELAEAGEPLGAVVIAEAQTAGRGRFGRPWSSPPDVGLYFSVILRPRLAAADAPVATLALGVAAANAIQAATGLTCDLRWPNDVLLGGRKCCGILTELAANADRVRYLVAGLGVNVNQSEMPPELAAASTSLRLETGREHDRESLLAAILKEVDRHMDMLVERGPAAIVELFTRASSFASGRRVVVTNGTAEVAGVTAGLTPVGTLLLRREDGAIVPVLAGSVRPAPE
jgi:BirA family biotin operon repressor/biotin-[acetyl-CoA-carboxylase] ligase